METSWLTVAWYAFLTAVATGLGALPFLAISTISRRFLGLSNALAAGLMGAASWSLIYEGLEFGMPRTVGGMLLGLGGIVLSHRWVNRREEVTWGKLEGVDATKVLMIVGVMTAHSFTEGVGIGVSFGGGSTLGGFITGAIAVHNIPEGLAISLVMIPRGSSVWNAGLWSVGSSLPQPLMAVPAFLFVRLFEPVLPVGLGFAAGAMLWMVIGELVPDALEDASANAVAVTVVVAAAAMIVFQHLIGGV